MKVRIKLQSITLVGIRKNYTIPFRDGFNYISGHTSTGKTSILEMIDYALGSKGHKSYIEIGSSCTHVELVLFLGQTKFKIRRQLFNFKAPVIVEDWNEEKHKFMFYNTYDINSPSNPKSLSAFIIEKLGLGNITISGQAFSFRDLYRYCYIKQTEIDNEDIMNEKTWEKDFKRKATFEIIFNIYDKTLEEYKRNLEIKREEAKELETKLSGIRDFLKSIDIVDLKECSSREETLHDQIRILQQQLSLLKSGKEVNTEITMILRKEIEHIKTQYQNYEEEKNDQKQYISKLHLLYNQYTSEIEKKELAIQGYLSFNQYEFLFCPNCLRPINIPDNKEACCLCGSEKKDDKSELIILKKDITVLRRKANELIKFTEIEEKKYDKILRKQGELRTKLHESELELQHLTKGYVNPDIEKIEYLNYEIGKKNRLVVELKKDLKMFEEVERYQQLIKDKYSSIEILYSNIKELSTNTVDKDDLMKQLSETFKTILEAFEYPKLSSAYINNKRYLPYVRDRKYDDIGSLAGVTLITVAYYMSLLMVGSATEFYHPNLLIIDSPRKNLGAQAAKDEDEEFKDEKIFNATLKYLYETAEGMKDNIQLIVVNNGYPDFLPKECIIKEFDSDGKQGLPKGLIDDAN